MDNNKIIEIFSQFDVKDNLVSIKPFGDGHINDTFLVTCANSKYTLQQLNHNVFREPEHVMHNIRMVTEHLAKKIVAAGGDPMRETLNIIRTKDGNTHYFDGQQGFFRMFTFVDGARSYPAVEKPEHFYNAARTFGRFQNMLADFPANELYETIPNFHNTVSRYNDFMKAVEEDKAGRRAFIEDDIAFVTARKDMCSVVLDSIENGTVPVRVTHNDTKYDNILIDDETGKGICVIDLDTVMPGSMLYDYGDSLRFGTNAGAEDEKDLSKVWCRLDLFEEFTRGFIEELGSSMTEREFELMPIAGRLITFECGMRFLTDFLNGDVYFKIHRPSHNLDRARAQFKLAEDMEKHEAEMVEIVNKIRREVLS